MILPLSPIFPSPFVKKRTRDLPIREVLLILAPGLKKLELHSPRLEKKEYPFADVLRVNSCGLECLSVPWDLCMSNDVDYGSPPLCSRHLNTFHSRYGKSCSKNQKT